MAGAPRGREPDDAADGVAEPIMPAAGPTPEPTRPPRTPSTERARTAAPAATHPEPRRRRDESRSTRSRPGRPGDPGKTPPRRAIDERTVILPTVVPGGRPAASRRTRVMVFLRDLDRRVLPPAAGLLTRFARSGLRIRRIVAALAAVAIVAAIVLAVYTATRPPPRIARSEPTVAVGARPGVWIPAYVEDRREVLQRMIADPRATSGVYALVSFNTYLDPARVTALLGHVQVAEVFLHAKLAVGPTKIVQAPANRLPGDLVQAMRGQAANYSTVADDLDTLIHMVSGDTADDAALREKYEDARTLAQAEATAYRNLLPCVFAAVVFGPPVTLGQLADEPEVRVVDPFNRGQAPDPSTYAPPVPEQKGVAAPLPVEDGTSP